MGRHKARSRRDPSGALSVKLRDYARIAGPAIALLVAGCNVSRTGRVGAGPSGAAASRVQKDPRIADRVGTVRLGIIGQEVLLSDDSVRGLGPNELDIRAADAIRNMYRNNMDRNGPLNSDSATVILSQIPSRDLPECTKCAADATSTSVLLACGGHSDQGPGNVPRGSCRWHKHDRLPCLRHAVVTINGKHIKGSVSFASEQITCDYDAQHRAQAIRHEQRELLILDRATLVDELLAACDWSAPGGTFAADLRFEVETNGQRVSTTLKAIRLPYEPSVFQFNPARRQLPDARAYVSLLVSPTYSLELSGGWATLANSSRPISVHGQNRKQATVGRSGFSFPGGYGSSPSAQVYRVIPVIVHRAIRDGEPITSSTKAEFSSIFNDWWEKHRQDAASRALADRAAVRERAQRAQAEKDRLAQDARDRAEEARRRDTAQRQIELDAEQDRLRRRAGSRQALLEEFAQEHRTLIFEAVLPDAAFAVGGFKGLTVRGQGLVVGVRYVFSPVIRGFRGDDNWLSVDVEVGSDGVISRIDARTNSWAFTPFNTTDAIRKWIQSAASEDDHDSLATRDMKRALRASLDDDARTLLRKLLSLRWEASGFRARWLDAPEEPLR